MPQPDDTPTPTQPPDRPVDPPGPPPDRPGPAQAAGAAGPPPGWLRRQTHATPLLPGGSATRSARGRDPRLRAGRLQPGAGHGRPRRKRG